MDVPQALIHALAEAQHVAVLTGAGISSLMQLRLAGPSGKILPLLFGRMPGVQPGSPEENQTQS
jgi:hypothetical protein